MDFSATRSLHESLIELLPDAMLALDVQGGRFVLANVAAERLLATTRTQLTQLGLRDLVRPWDLGQVARIEAALCIERQWRGELWLKRQDGTFVPTEVVAQAMSLDGRILAQLCCRDMTARWRDDAMRRVVSDAAERLAATADDVDALRTVVTVALPGLADAALVELDAVDGDEADAIAAFADPARAGWPAVAVDDAPSSETRAALRRGSTLTVPLLAQGRRIGTLTLRRTADRLWDPGDQPLVEELANHAAHAIDKARQSTDARLELNQRAAMLRLLSAIDTDATPRRVFEMLVEEAQAAIQADDGGATRWDFERGILLPGLHGPKAGRLCGVDPRLMVAVAASERCALIENDYQRTMGRNTPAGRAGAQAVLAVPMLHDDAVLGSISISHIRSPRRFKPSEVRRVEMLASTAATTVAGMYRQRTAGAQAIAREAAHLLNNDLTLTMGSLDMVRETDGLPPEVGALVDTALEGVTRAAAHIAELQRMKHDEVHGIPR
jgi:PAS domain S-box-containing protein